MKKSLTHLPKQKRDELNRIVQTIRTSTQPEMIILFGSYTRGNWKDGPHEQTRAGGQRAFSVCKFKLILVM